jgi:putative membrane-bound dehydrogenase-like protein
MPLVSISAYSVSLGSALCRMVPGVRGGEWMFRLVFIAGAFCLTTLCCADLPPLKSVEVNGRRFEIPEGFTLEVAADTHCVERPIHVAFDDQGNLYVSNSSGTNDPVDRQLEEKPHGIYRLKDSNGDGIYDQSQLFADKLMFPEGTMWHDGSLYVTAPPAIWKLTDRDGDGRADDRQVWFDGKTLTSCANDLHGPYLGLDGRIYWAKGAFATQTYERPGKTPFVTRAAHIFRAKTDGTGIEPVMTGGMDNPVDVVFMPDGERLFNGTFFQNPAGGKRDGIIHAIYGGVYGKLHDPIYDPIHPWTGPDVMPILVHLGPAAPSGFHRYLSSRWGDEYRDNLFNTCFNLRKVTRHTLVAEGASFRATTEDILRTDDLDFHPTDVVEDADGSLLIVNTGGWYKLCCPTSQLHKPDILGCIYRLRKNQVLPQENPRGEDLDWDQMQSEELVQRLDDPRPVVRNRALEHLRQLGEVAIPVLMRVYDDPVATTERKQNAIWGAIRMDHPEARRLVRRATTDPASMIRHVAIHGIGLWRDREGFPELLQALDSADRSIQRVAAEALGRIGSPDAIEPLLRALPKAIDDRVLQHSLTYALIEIDAPAVLAAAIHGKAGEGLTGIGRQSAIIALDQLGGHVPVEWILTDLNSSDSDLRGTAMWISLRHPEWGGDLMKYWREQLRHITSTAQAEEIASLLAQMASSAEIQALIADHALDRTVSEASRLGAFLAMKQADLETTPVRWMSAIQQVLSQSHVSDIASAVGAAQGIRLPEEWNQDSTLSSIVTRIDEALLRISGSNDLPAELRALAAAGVRGPVKEMDPKLFSFLLESLHDTASVIRRSAAADAISDSVLNSEQRLVLARAMAEVGPFELLKLLTAFAGCSDDRVGQQLLASLEKSTAKAAVRSDLLKPILEHLGADVRSRGEQLLSALDVHAEERKRLLESVLAMVPEGDIRRGQAVFNSPKVACISCHEMGYVGGHIGPDLSRIGSVRSERDLLEAILFPSASFVRSYESITVQTDEGRILNGVIKHDAAHELVLTISATEEARIARSSIEEMFPGTVSIMPAGLDQQLTPQELADLVAFLKASQ